MPRLLDDAEIGRAADLLLAGGLVAFPTETVYGLGADALNAEAVARVYAVKRRPSTSPLIVHVASIEMARTLVAWDELAERLAQRFWPGPLTLVLTKACRGSAIAPAVSAGLPTIGIRMPAHPVALALISKANVPIAAPSANRFTEVSPTTAEHVRQSLGDEVDLILDGGQCDVGIESTVISVFDSVPRLLRPGGLSRKDLEGVIGPVVVEVEPLSTAHLSPGMHRRHYSPRTPLYLVKDGKLPERGNGFYLQYKNDPSREAASVCRMPQGALEYAAQLYSVLRQADSRRLDWIAVDSPPDDPEWEAIKDRLSRATER